MRNAPKQLIILLSILNGMMIMTTSCTKETDKVLALPVVTTTEVTSISSTYAKSGGVITSDAGSNITARGLCWSITSTPTIADNKTSDGSGIGTFTSSMTGLTAASTYYVRAYATNSQGTGYGRAYQFTTLINTAGTITTELIPVGTFTMGSPTTEVNRSSEETQYQVTISAYQMSKYEITNAQYASFLNTKGIGSDGLYAAGAYPTQTLIVPTSGGYDFGLHYSGSQWTPVAGYETSPVINVTWYGATVFANYVGGALPTEAQWEYACRAGTTTPFSTGNFLTNLQANYNWTYPYNGGTNTVTTRSSKTNPVGTYAPNIYGLYDMHGNVWEWCADYYGTYPTNAQTNPKGASSGLFRVIRGGDWDDKALDCRSANRSNRDPSISLITLGFRVVFAP